MELRNLPSVRHMPSTFLYIEGWSLNTEYCKPPSRLCQFLLHLLDNDVLSSYNWQNDSLVDEFAFFCRVALLRGPVTRCVSIQFANRFSPLVVISILVFERQKIYTLVCFGFIRCSLHSIPIFLK